MEADVLMYNQYHHVILINNVRPKIFNKNAF